MSKNAVLPAWELNFHGFLFFCVFCVFGGHLENSSFTCMGAQFRRSRAAILRFLCFLEMLKKHVFRQGRFFTFFHDFWCLLGGLLALLWRPFGAPVASLACWRRPFGCLWLAWAVRGLSLLLFVVPFCSSGLFWGSFCSFWQFFGIFVGFWVHFRIISG